MARISELHYSNAYARNSGVSEFLEVALRPSEDPADFVVGFYEADGSLGIEVPLTDPRVTMTIDPDNGERIYVLSADNLPIQLTDPDGGGANNYEAFALTDTATSEVIDFYDIGGGAQNITALGGAAAGAVSENLPVLTGPSSTTSTIQFNQPDPGQVSYGPAGAGDTGLACFVAGTRVQTPSGPRRIEALAPGDLVLTRDEGALPVRWIGRRCVRGTGDFAPVRFAAGRYGATAPVWVSPQHRVLIDGWRAELYCGAEEILVPAKALVDGRGVRQQPRAQVCYVHLLFDSHQIVQTCGLWSESYFPALAGIAGGCEATERELAALFPDLTRDGFGAAARPVQRVRIGALLRAA
ncbi:type I secretion protein [Roseovarius spongiae]|uniref:Type I secretion protein n=1 Tax=Roseovarius spongiae TaxID=2320272 RepID=A0A3A8AWH7_9RHOB|nr:Hint domain-containing protein [Roseovarius spongiae]RKF13984.1 type I secretion protein [Roseovarius spongiae]